MKPAFVKQKPKYPLDWQELPAGDTLKQIIEICLNDYSRHMFGYHMVKLGCLSSAIQLPDCPIKHTTSICHQPGEHIHLLAKNSKLPLQENSVDAFLLANELDFSRDPHQILREINRAIIPNGHLIIVGFNPFSLAGLLKYLPVNRNSILHDARFFSRPRVKDWLSLLGFEIVGQESRVFSELFFKRNFRPNSAWQNFAERYLPLLSALYILVARKRVVPLSLIKPQWRPKPKFSAVGASMRNGA